MRTCVQASIGAVRLIACDASMVEFMRGLSSLKNDAMVKGQDAFLGAAGKWCKDCDKCAVNDSRDADLK